MKYLALFLLLVCYPLSGASVFIDCGSSGDQYFSGGSPFTITTPGATGDLTERFGAFAYKIPSPPGLYALSLYFRETGTVTAVGQRKFSVKINEQPPVLDQFDLFAIAGLSPIRRDFLAYSVDGFINLTFSYTKKSAIVSAIEVTPFVSSGTTVSYVVPSDPKRELVTDAVPNWVNDAYYVPRPISEPDGTVLITYQNIQVFHNGVKARTTRTMLGGAEILFTSLLGQLAFRPADGNKWPDTDWIEVSYQAIWPLNPGPLPPQ